MEIQENRMIGPVLPPTPTQNEDKREKECVNDKNNEETKSINESYGPALPPHLQKPKRSEDVSIGPSLPPHLREKLEKQVPENDFPDESSEEEEIYGPIVPGQEMKSRAQLALEERALEMKLNNLNPEEQKVQREEWMTELPTVSASKLGLGPRQFRAKAGPDMSDRSSWTDTPDTKKKKKADKVNLKEEMEISNQKNRDKEQEKMAKKHKRESHSLLELHQKKRKKEKSEAPKERIPFNRETDLQVNKFDEAQKAAVLKKAQLLDDRFSQGKSKFL